MNGQKKLQRRWLLALVATLAAAWLTPMSARASCYPLPAACPPGTIKPPVPIPTNPNFPADVNNLINNINKGFPNPIYSVWPEMNTAIVGDADAGTLAFAPADQKVRHGGRLFVQNLTLQAHTVTDIGCLDAAGHYNGGACLFRIGLQPLSAGLTAGVINIETVKYAIGTTYRFQCELHPNLKGSFIPA